MLWQFRLVFTACALCSCGSILHDVVMVIVCINTPVLNYCCFKCFHCRFAPVVEMPLDQY